MRCWRSPIGSRSLRRGKVVGETTPAQTSKEAGRDDGRSSVLFRLDKPTVELGEPILQVQGLTGGGSTG
jgi:hypothetical protein